MVGTETIVNEKGGTMQGRSTCARRAQPGRYSRSHTGMEQTPFTWKQRFSLFAIYFVLIPPVFDVIYFTRAQIFPGIPIYPGIRRPSPFPTAVSAMAVIVGLAMVATFLTERYSWGLFRYAI